eukprot:4623229-Pyramimonas_sp.AAC.2
MAKAAFISSRCPQTSSAAPSIATACLLFAGSLTMLRCGDAIVSATALPHHLLLLLFLPPPRPPSPPPRPRPPLQNHP